MTRIEDLIRALGEGKVIISNHADEEAQNDELSFDEVYFSANHGEIIEEYPTDRPYPQLPGLRGHLQRRPGP